MVPPVRSEVTLLLPLLFMPGGACIIDILDSGTIVALNFYSRSGLLRCNSEVIAAPEPPGVSDVTSNALGFCFVSPVFDSRPKYQSNLNILTGETHFIHHAVSFSSSTLSVL